MPNRKPQTIPRVPPEKPLTVNVKSGLKVFFDSKAFANKPDRMELYYQQAVTKAEQSEGVRKANYETVAEIISYMYLKHFGAAVPEARQG